MNFSKTKYMDFLKMVAPLAIPIIIQNFLTSSLGMLDGIMIAHHGDATQATISMAAVSQANRVFFAVMLFFFGLAAGASIFFSQFYGKKDFDGLRKVLGLAISLGFMISLIPFFGSIFFAKELMGIFVSTNDTEVIELGARFLHIIGWSYPLYIMTWIYGYALRSIGHPNVYMFSSVAALTVNAILNYFLIFGFGPIPALGVTGAALGTALARVVEFFILFGFIYTRKNNPLRANFSQLFAFNWSDMKNFFKTTLPVILQEGLWGLGATVIYIIYGTIGRTTLAAVGIISPFLDLAFVALFALSQATSIIMGNMIGEQRDREEIRWTAKRCLWLGFGFSWVMIALLSFIPYYLIPIFYPVEKEAIELARYAIWGFCFLMICRGTQMLGTIGVLRGAGDTLYAMVVDLVGMWLVMVPMVYYTAVVLKWSLPFVEISGIFYDIVALFFVLWRVRGDKWINDVTDKEKGKNKDLFLK